MHVEDVEEVSGLSVALSSAKAVATRRSESWKKSRSLLYRLDSGARWIAAPPAR
jgi:hypothetical protein